MSEQKEAPKKEEPVVAAGPAPVHAAPVHAGPTNGLAIASLVLGILAVLSGWFFMGLFFGIAAVVLGIIAMKKPGGKGMSIAGIITGGLGALSSLIFVAIFFIALAAGGALVGQGAAISQAIDDQYAAQQAQIDAKKDFDKGQTAHFGSFDVKANSVKRNYVPDEEYYAAGADSEYVLVNVSVTNKGSESETFSGYELSLNADGIADTSYFITVSPAFTGGNLSPDATATGNLVFKIAKDAKKLKLQFEDTVYDTKDYSTKNLTYTLDI